MKAKDYQGKNKKNSQMLFKRPGGLEPGFLFKIRWWI